MTIFTWKEVQRVCYTFEKHFQAFPHDLKHIYEVAKILTSKNRKIDDFTDAIKIECMAGQVRFFPRRLRKP